jgi:multidrug efflux pump subunit AcrB
VSQILVDCTEFLIFHFSNLTPWRLGTEFVAARIDAAAHGGQPVIGYLSGRSAEADVPMLAALRQGLARKPVGRGQIRRAAENIATLDALGGEIDDVFSQRLPEITDANSDQQNNGLETDITIDRATAARLGITVSQIDNTLYDAFGQRQVSSLLRRAQ